MSIEDKAIKAMQGQNTKIKDFSEMLATIEDLSDKQKRLLLEIYTNAAEDRNNAYIMFGKLADLAGSTSTEHAVHGGTMVKYIERMTRANDQLLKLVVILREIENKDGNDDPEALYKLFGKKN